LRAEQRAAGRRVLPAGRCFKGVAAALGLLAALPPAAAHVRVAPGPASGIAIAGLTHGQMAVVAKYQGEIEYLADRQMPTDLTFRRLLNYARIQRTYCLWGIVPGSLSDETSPFNECSHAYLAAFRAVLQHMREMPGGNRAVNGLIGRMDADMVRRQASFVLCAFSEEPFNTANVLEPALRDVLDHPPTLAAAGTLLLALLALVALFRAVRHPAGPPGMRGDP
jgi:hypothetical protein